MSVSVEELAARLGKMERQIEKLDAGATVERAEYGRRRNWVLRLLARYERLAGACRAGLLTDEVVPESADERQIDERNFCLDIEAALEGLAKRESAEEWGCYGSGAGETALKLVQMLVFGLPKADDMEPGQSWGLGSAAKQLRLDFRLAAKLYARAIDFLWADLADYREDA